jgi:hypothetical protein
MQEWSLPVRKGRIDMSKSRKQQKAGGEVLRNAKEVTQIEQYWHVLGQAKPRKPPKDYNYVEELAHL